MSCLYTDTNDIKKTSIIIIIQFLTLPNATVYGGIGFISARSKESNWFISTIQTYLLRVSKAYLNSFLAVFVFLSSLSQA